MKELLRMKREKGLTLPEMMVWLGVFAVVGSFIAVMGAGILTGTRLEQANQEVQSVILASQTWRSLKGNYTGISIKELKDNGYNVNFSLNGVNGVNLYDENVEIASSSAQDAKVTYVTTATTDCNQLLDRVKILPNITGEACAAATFTLTFDL